MLFSKRLTRFLIFACCLIQLTFGVDPTNFKTCEQSSFCRRCRKVSADNTKFAIVPGSVSSYSDSITAELINQDSKHLYVFKLEALVRNTFRVVIDEKSPLKQRYRVEHALRQPPKTGHIKVLNENSEQMTIASGPNKAVITARPFRIDFYQDEVLSVSVNAKGLMNFEYLRTKPQQAEAGEEGAAENIQAADPVQATVAKTPEDEDPGAWEENFKSHHDSKPFGPEAVALDFAFPAADVLFGIPEHADNFVLKTTSGTDPYRLYNLDVFEYVLDSKMALYGAIPVIYGHGTQRTAGVFWHNAAETWVDIHTEEKNVVSSIVNFVAGSGKTAPPTAHFMSESGIIDAFILMGPTPLEVFQQYTHLTGTANLPQLYSLAYHQSRWNYNDGKDVQTVNEKFDEYDIPMDTMWLDIEYTDAKKYFTWDVFKFHDPIETINNLTDVGRHLVIIIDPHIKRDSNYFFHNECTNRGLYVKTREGNDYEGWCWPGSSSYLDVFNPMVRSFYGEQYSKTNFVTITDDVGIWNDMNEPSVFNGPEITMPKDMIHYGNWEHRDVHNIYGHMFVMGTHEGLMARSPNLRPFILSRSHFAGTQRYAAIWTGDNMAEWSHLQSSIKMCLSEAVAGMSFCGADVGGFFNNPEPELLARWYQTGAFLPFFRAHAHIDTKRREPWLMPEKVMLIIRDAIRKRYTYLPLFYTAFYEHERYGLPVIRPLLAHYPKDKQIFSQDQSFLLQDRLLVSPVMQQGVSKIDVHFPAINEQRTIGDLWYDVDTFEKIDKVGILSIPVDEHKIPVYQRGGSILPKKERVRRASTLMKNDPYTIIVCVDRANKAKGTLYLDDEKTFDYRDGKYIYVEYEFDGTYFNNRLIDTPKYATKSWLERVVIAGLHKKPTSATITIDGVSQTLEVLPWYGDNAVAIRKPGVNMAIDFSIKLNFK